MLCVTLPFKPAIVFHCGEGVGGTGLLRGWAIAVFVQWIQPPAFFFYMQMRREA